MAKAKVNRVILSNPHPDVDKLKDRVKSMQDQHASFLAEIQEITEKIKAQKEYKQQDSVDIGFLCREIEELCESWRKEGKARKELIGQLIAATWVRENIGNDDPPANVPGTLATGSPSFKKQYALPYKGTEEYKQLMTWIGVPDDVQGGGLVKPSWDDVNAYANKLLEDGFTGLIPGLQKTYDLYVTTFRRKPAPKSAPVEL